MKKKCVFLLVAYLQKINKHNPAMDPIIQLGIID